MPANIDGHRRTPGQIDEEKVYRDQRAAAGSDGREHWRTSTDASGPVPAVQWLAGPAHLPMIVRSGRTDP